MAHKLLGWAADGSAVDATALLLGAALQLGAEVLVDLLCVRVEEREGIPVREAWRLMLGVVEVVPVPVPEDNEEGDGDQGAPIHCSRSLTATATEASRLRKSTTSPKH